MLLPWVVGARVAKELIFTGDDRVPAEQALRIGLVNRVVARETLDEETLALAEEIAKNEPFVVRAMKASINRAWELAGMPERSMRTSSSTSRSRPRTCPPATSSAGSRRRRG